MKCPYCEREMQKGYIYDGTKPVQWIPNGGRVPLFRGGIADSAVVLGDGGVWRGWTADASYCQACKIVITSVK